jgi:GT2 family glycosyltransferase
VIPPRHLEFRYFDFDSPRRRENVAALCGGNHSIRRATALAIGGYDENYLGWAFREETDLALRLIRVGKQIVFDPRAGLLHLATPSGGCRLSGFQQMLQQWKMSFPAHYFCWKHLWGSRCFWQELGESFRRSILCRHNVAAPYRLPAAAVSFAFSLGYSWWRCRRCN